MIAAFVLAAAHRLPPLPARRGRRRPWLAASIRSRRCRSARYAGAVRWSLRLWFGALMVFLYLPIAFMIIFSFDESQHARAADHGPHAPLVRRDAPQPAAPAERSATRSRSRSSSAILATIIGTMAAFVLVRGRIRYPSAIRIAFTLPIMVPGVLIGVALLIYFARAARPPALAGHGVAGQLVFTVPVRGPHRGQRACRASTGRSSGPRPTSARRHGRRSGTSSCRSSRRPSWPVR